MIMERAMGIEPKSEAWESSDRCDDGKFWCNFGAVKRGKNRACSRKRRQGNGLEFLPSWFVARRSIQLSYGRTVHCLLSTAYRKVSHSISTLSVSVLWGSEVMCFGKVIPLIREYLTKELFRF